jgi:5-(carboxyamino)imidazole ribonucleotide synthase
MTRTIGVLGAGQLGRMLAQASLPLDIRCRFFDPAEETVASSVGEVVTAAYGDEAAQARFAAGCDVITWEFENVSLAAVDALAKRVPVRPGRAALAAKQDRLDEKQFLTSLGIATAPFAEVSTRAQLDAAVAAIGLPAVLKTRRDGYDGKGQCVLRTAADLAPAWDELGAVPLILEGFIAFSRECSIVAVCGQDGTIGFWPVVENEHRQGILHRSLAPAPHAWVIQEQAELAARAVMERLDYVGVFVVEFF